MWNFKSIETMNKGFFFFLATLSLIDATQPVSPFLFFTSDNETTENKATGIDGQNLTMQWKLDNISIVDWHYDKNLRTSYNDLLVTQTNSFWAFWCPPGSNAYIQGVFSIKKNLDTMYNKIKEALTRNDVPSFISGTQLKKIGCHPLNRAAWFMVDEVGVNKFDRNEPVSTRLPVLSSPRRNVLEAQVTLPMIGYGTMWFVSNIGATPFHFDPQDWSHESEVEMDSRRVYFCPSNIHQNVQTLMLSDPPRCQSSIDDDYMKGVKIVDVTIFIPHIVFYSHEVRACYMKDVLMHCYENFIGQRDTCAPCPVVVYPNKIDKKTCEKWNPGSHCFSPPPTANALDILKEAIFGKKEKMKDSYDVGKMKKYGEGARTNNAIYPEYDWWGVKEFSIRNCFMEKGTVSVKGPYFDDFQTQWGKIKTSDALKGEARLGIHKYSGYFKKFEQDDMCYYIAQMTIKNVKMRTIPIRSGEGNAGQSLPPDASFTIQITSEKLASTFGTYDSQKLDDVPSCIKSHNTETYGEFYYMNEDRLMRISNRRDPRKVLESEKLIYESGYSTRVSASASSNHEPSTHREVKKKIARSTKIKKSVGKLNPDKQIPPRFVNFVSTPEAKKAIDDRRAVDDSKFIVGTPNEQMTFMAAELQRIINHNAALGEQTRCLSKKTEHDRRKLNAILFPSQEASRLVGKRVKVIGPGGDFMRFTPCLPIDYELVENVRTNNAADLDPKYIYRVFPPPDAQRRFTEKDINETSAMNGSLNIMYLHHDLFNQTFGTETKYPKTYLDVFKLSGVDLVNTTSACFIRPLLVFQDPGNPRIKIVAQLDSQYNVQMQLRDIGYCPDVQIFSIEEVVAVYLNGILTGLIDRHLFNDHKRMKEIRKKAILEERREAKVKEQLQSVMKTGNSDGDSMTDEEFPASLHPVLTEGEEFKTKTTISIDEIRESVGLSHGGSVYAITDTGEGKSDLLRFMTRVVVAEDKYSHSQAANVPDMFFNLFDDQSYDMNKRLQSVEERSVHELMLDMVRRTDMQDLSYIGNSKLIGGLIVPNETDDSAWNRASRKMNGAVFNGGFLDNIGSGLDGLFHTVVDDGAYLVSTAGGLLKGGVEGVSEVAGKTINNVLGGLFDGIGGKILIGLGAVVGVCLFVFILFKCMSVERGKKEDKTDQQVLVQDISNQSPVEVSETMHEKSY